jgi:hypothetical protein
MPGHGGEVDIFQIRGHPFKAVAGIFFAVDMDYCSTA